MRIIALLLAFSLCGCGSDKGVYYHEYKTSNYTVCSYRPLTQEEIDGIYDVFRKTMYFLKQDKLRKTFKIKLVYDNYALSEYWGRKKYGVWDSDVGGWYEQRCREIILPNYNFRGDVLAHELTHAILHINKIKQVDDESRAVLIGKKIHKELICD